MTFCAYAVLSAISLGGGFDDAKKWRAGSLPSIICSFFRRES